MPTSATQYFDFVEVYDGSSFTDRTLESQSPGGTAFSVLEGTDDFLYLGDASRFDMAMFELATAGSLGTLKYEYYNGSAWTEFTPLSASYQHDPDDNEDTMYSFSGDGAEQIPVGRLANWATTTIDSESAYWIRISSPTSVTTAPTIKSIRKRGINTYCAPPDVYSLLQLEGVLGSDNFTSSTTPTLKTVETLINEAESKIDHITRKSWRPNIAYNEYHEFNINGFKLDKQDPYKIVNFKIWNGGAYDSKTQGRRSDFFLIQDTGMLHFSRYFLLPARFTSYNAPLFRFGGGEFTQPIKVDYLYGRDIHTDAREGAVITEVCKKLVAADILRNADFGDVTVSGLDRVQITEKVTQFTEESMDILDSLRAFEVF